MSLIAHHGTIPFIKMCILFQIEGCYQIGNRKECFIFNEYLRLNTNELFTFKPILKKDSKQTDLIMLCIDSN